VLWCGLAGYLSDFLAVLAHHVHGAYPRRVVAAPAIHQVGDICCRIFADGSIDEVIVPAAEVLVGTSVTFQAVFALTAVEFVVALTTIQCSVEGADAVIVTCLTPDDVVACLAFYVVCAPPPFITSLPESSTK
jgi:hypothetical protein